MKRDTDEKRKGRISRKVREAKKTETLEGEKGEIGAIKGDELGGKFRKQERGSVA